MGIMTEEISNLLSIISAIFDYGESTVGNAVEFGVHTEIWAINKHTLLFVGLFLLSTGVVAVVMICNCHHSNLMQLVACTGLVR